jgi:hypothetical protein
MSAETTKGKKRKRVKRKKMKRKKIEQHGGRNCTQGCMRTTRSKDQQRGYVQGIAYSAREQECVVLPALPHLRLRTGGMQMFQPLRQLKHRNKIK